MSVIKHKCAFHPSEAIVNFCRSPGCYLPMCPTCIRIHSEEHRSESTYGQFQNINSVVEQIEYNINSLDKLLVGMLNDSGDMFEAKKRIEADLRKKITDAKAKIIQQIDRYFIDIESSLYKSITNYKEVTTEEYSKLQKQINEIRRVLKFNMDNLNTERSLKTLITYHIDDSLNSWKTEVKRIETKIEEIKDQTAVLVVDENIIIEVMERLDQYLGVSYQGYSEKGFHAKQYSKTKLGSTSRVGTVHND